jgi:hypothetical protein
MPGVDVLFLERWRGGELHERSSSLRGTPPVVSLGRRAGQVCPSSRESASSRGMLLVGLDSSRPARSLGENDEDAAERQNVAVGSATNTPVVGRV